MTSLPFSRSPATELEETLSSRVLVTQDNDGTSLKLVADDIENGNRFVQEHQIEGTPVRVVSAQRFNALVLEQFRTEISLKAKSIQSDAFPELSARTVFSQQQKFALWCGVLVLIMGFVQWPNQAAVATMAVLTFAMFIAAVFKAALITCSICNSQSDPQYPVLEGDDLPTFSILFPLFREAKMVPRLIQVIENLNYPEDKIEVCFVIEEEDDELVHLFETLTLPRNATYLTVPSSYPQTKPKAINVALQLCTGEIVSVFDAEDQIDPDHLRQVAYVFRTGSDRLACVQTALEFKAKRHNWLTRQFTLEYSVWYNLVLPSISWLGFPVPLGGTGNHFNRRILNEVGAWDCYNVTEDADLGMRLHFCGYKVHVLPILTIEDPNPNVFSWIRQRSRWIKGHMQTYVIYMRNPLRTLQRFGWSSFLALQALFGLTFVVSLLNPVIWMMFLIWVLTQTGVFDFVFPTATLMIGTFNLLIMNAFFLLTGLLAATFPGRETMAPAAFTTIIYSFLSSAAAFRALWQLFFKPHFWEKTEHPVLEEEAS